MALRAPAHLASETVAGAFGAVARLRGARAVHPHGPAFEATATLGPVAGVPALDRRRDVQAILRRSRSFGFPQPLPDVQGVALRLLDLHGEDRHQDVLVVSCVPGPFVNPIPLVTGDRSWTHCSSLLPLRLGGRLAFLGARRTAPAAFDLTWGTLGGRWQPFGAVQVHLDRRLADERTEALRLDPVLHAGPGMVLAGSALRDLRARAYRESRAARPLARA
ncbi:MAG TPA: hypothetical protein VD931_00675 [Baekduia sp.]|nr:hypothetical protein [Baekduia sp.]